MLSKVLHVSFPFHYQSYTTLLFLAVRSEVMKALRLSHKYSCILHNS